MRKSLLLAVLCGLVCSSHSRLSAQTVLVPGAWPTWGACYLPLTQYDGLQVLFDPTAAQGCKVTDAAARLTLGNTWISPFFAQLGVVDTTHRYGSALGRWYSAIAPMRSSVLRSSWGDLVLAATTSKPYLTFGGAPTTAAIRLSTTPNDSALDAEKPRDVERLTILGNGNVGIDVPPNLATGLCQPLDEVQIGGCVVPYPGNAAATPGLTIYGGTALENTPIPGGGGSLYPGDWRYISFNHYVDHSDPGPRRSYRIQPMGSSQIGFSDAAGGMLDFATMPFNTVMSHDSAMRDFTGGVSLHMTSNEGLFVWSDETKRGEIQYHHLMDLYRPGVTPWPLSRNTNGLFIHHTPVLITSDTTSTPSIDFTHLANVHPNWGDGDTWSLAVSGPALFKEAYVNSNDWPDYVFQPEYELRSIEEFGAYIKLNHHLPQIPSAKEMTGAVAIGKTQEALTKQVEEMALYIVQLNEQLESLRAEVAAMKGGAK